MQYSPRMSPANRMEVSLRRIVVGYRAISAVWLTVLAAIALSQDEPDRPAVVLMTVTVVLVWSGITLWLSYRAPNQLGAVVYLAVDFVITFGVLVSPDLAGSADFYGGYPVSSIFMAVYATGLPGAVAATVMVTAVALWRAIGPRSTEAVFGLITSVVVYPFIAVPATWAVGVLRRTDRLRREAEAALDAERAERIRAEERAELAAHLHDSVLQSLALIQRNPNDHDEVRAIARRQERDLRLWLSGAVSDDSSFADAISQVVSDVEERHRVAVELVIVGDATVDARLESLLGAAREAIVNAAKHSGAEVVSVYAEIDAANAAVFIRDRGAGFDVDAVPTDRRGLAESIHGRMRRSGGSASVVTTVGRGTEVRLTLPPQTDEAPEG